MQYVYEGPQHICFEFLLVQSQLKSDYFYGHSVWYGSI